MGRYRSRSRSPASNGPSKRRRDEDRYDGRTRLRSRSRSRERRDHHDRDRDRRRDRSSDRRRDDRYSNADDDRRGGRDRDYHRRERDRERDSHKDRDRERDRDRDRDRRDRIRDDDSKRGSRHEVFKSVPEVTDLTNKKQSPATKPSTPTTLTEEEKKQQRQEKLEAWKKKRAEEEEAKKKSTSVTLRDASTTGSPGTVAAAAAAALEDTKKTVSNGKPPSVSLNVSKSASPSIASAPNSAKKGEFKADKLPFIATKPVTEASPIISTLPSNRAVSGFGFKGTAKKIGPETKGKRSLDFDDEDTSRKKLERLPSPVPEDSSINGEQQAEDGDDDVDMQDDSEEASAAAARAAAAARDERVKDEKMQLDQTTSDVPDLTKNQAEPTAEDDDDEDVDPLDAFMSNMKEDRLQPFSSLQNGTQAEALFGDDEVDLVVLENDPDDILALASKMKKKKELPSIDHNKVKYEPFRKDFYVEPAELQEMTEQEVDDLRLEMDGIKIRGVDCPKPVQKWSSLGLPATTHDVITKLGYERPTSIQSQAIPAVMSGRNVIGVAKTGSGKTMAFLLPMFRHIKDQRPLESLDGPIALIMTPTRELATQIYKECKPFLKVLNLRGVCAYGGSPIKDQIAELKRGAEFIVCTPGRMIDLLAANSGRVTNLKRVTYVVLDEADRMFDMGFEPQVMKIIGNIRPDRQTVLFSATFPKQMEALARKVLIKPVEIVVGARSVVAPEVTQIVEVRAEDTKFVRLLELLGELYDKDEDARTLIFVDRQDSADTLLKDLMRRGYPCMSIHGSKEQIDRDSAIADFKAGVIPILVATSVAARGLDVKQLKLVVNYDCPNHMEDYVHRVGRTGRAGNKGTAVTFITTEQDRYANDIAKALKASGQDVPNDIQVLVEGFVEKIRSGKEKVGNAGFGGKGLDRLDQERESARKRERKAYGEEGAEEAETVDADGDDVLVKSTAAPSTPTTVVKGPSLDDKIVVHRREDTGGAANILDKVKIATSAIHNRLNKTGQLRTGVPIDNKGPDAGAFHATLEINDFPQKARWAVTNRTNIAKVLEATGTSITTKGSFYPAGKSPDAGQDPKLYILVEGDTELVVTSAMRELKRLLAEGTAAAVDSESRAPASARYSVI